MPRDQHGITARPRLTQELIFASFEGGAWAFRVRDAMNWKGSASGLVTKRCIRLGRVSAAEYFQGAFGQKAAPSAIEP
jgi:hypothetical protein